MYGSEDLITITFIRPAFDRILTVIAEHKCTIRKDFVWQVEEPLNYHYKYKRRAYIFITSDGWIAEAVNERWNIWWISKNIAEDLFVQKNRTQVQLLSVLITRFWVGERLGCGNLYTLWSLFLTASRNSMFQPGCMGDISTVGGFVTTLRWNSWYDQSPAWTCNNLPVIRRPHGVLLFYLLVCYDSDLWNTASSTNANTFHKSWLIAEARRLYMILGDVKRLISVGAFISMRHVDAKFTMNLSEGEYNLPSVVILIEIIVRKSIRPSPSSCQFSKLSIKYGIKIVICLGKCNWGDKILWLITGLFGCTYCVKIVLFPENTVARSRISLIHPTGYPFRRTKFRPKRTVIDTFVSYIQPSQPIIVWLVSW